MTTALERTTVGRYSDVIVTAGMIDGSTGKQIFGVFSSEDDARSIDADKLAIAVVTTDSLTDEQVDLAERNSEALAE